MNSSPRSQHGVLAAALVFAIATLMLGLAAGKAHPLHPSPWQNTVDVVFGAAGLLVLQAPDYDATRPGTLSAAQICAVAFAFFGVLGVLVELYRPASDRWVRLTSWFARVVRQKRPAIVIGLGRVGGPLAKAIRQQGRPVYAVALDDAAPPAAEARTLGTLVLTGDARDDRLRLRLPLDGGPEIFIATGDDARNHEIAGELLADVAARKSGGIRCHIHSADPTFASTLSTHHLLHDPGGRIRFAVFNLQEQAARAVLLDADSGILRTHAPAGVAHVILVGFGVMGQTLALQLGRLAHFDTLQRLRLTVIDHFDGAMTQFLERHPAFCPDPATFDLLTHRALDISDKDAWTCRRWRPADPAWRSDRADAVEYAVNAEFVDVPPAPAVPRAMVDALLARLMPAPQDPPLTQVLVIASDNEQRNFETALGFRDALEVARLEGFLDRVIPMYVYLPAERGLAQILETAPDFTSSAAVRVHTFGSCSASDAYVHAALPDVRRMAAVIHQRYNAAYGPGPAFEELAPMLQASNIDAAAHLDLKLDAIGYRRRPLASPSDTPPPLKLSSGDVEMLARMEHNRWLAERLISGWRIGDKRTATVGTTVHDNRRRLSFVPWETLSPRQREEKWKDIAQVAGLDAICGEAKQVVEPIPGRRQPDRSPASPA